MCFGDTHVYCRIRKQSLVVKETKRRISSPRSSKTVLNR